MRGPAAAPGAIDHQESHRGQLFDQVLHGRRAGVERAAACAAAEHDRAPQGRTGRGLGDADLHVDGFEVRTTDLQRPTRGVCDRTVLAGVREFPNAAQLRRRGKPAAQAHKQQAESNHPHIIEANVCQRPKP